MARVNSRLEGCFAVGSDGLVPRAALGDRAAVELLPTKKEKKTRNGIDDGCTDSSCIAKSSSEKRYMLSSSVTLFVGWICGNIYH